MLVGGDPGTGSLTHQAHDLTKLGWLLLLLILLVVLLEGGWAVGGAITRQCWTLSGLLELSGSADYLGYSLRRKMGHSVLELSRLLELELSGLLELSAHFLTYWYCHLKIVTTVWITGTVC